MLIQPSITVRDTNICMFKFNHLANMCEAGYGLFLYSRDQTDVHIWLPRVDFFMGQKLNCADSSPLNPSFYLQRKQLRYYFCVARHSLWPKMYGSILRQYYFKSTTDQAEKLSTHILKKITIVFLLPAFSAVICREEQFWDTLPKTACEVYKLCSIQSFSTLDMTVVLFTPPRSAAPGPAAPAQDWWLASSHNSVRVLKRQIQIVRVLCFFWFF